MKVSEILNKVTLKFNGGGKLNLSDYLPYIINGNEEVEIVEENNNEQEIEN